MAPTKFKIPPVAPAADDDDLPKALVPPAWPRPVGYANGMTAKGRIVVTAGLVGWEDRKSTRLNSSHQIISYAVFCLKKKKLPTPSSCFIGTHISTPDISQTRK